jgi:hypothetical protein
VLSPKFQSYVRLPEQFAGVAVALNWLLIPATPVARPLAVQVRVQDAPTLIVMAVAG